jgi:hypothetical protein
VKNPDLIIPCGQIRMSQFSQNSLAKASAWQNSLNSDISETDTTISLLFWRKCCQNGSQKKPNELFENSPK